MKPGPLASDQGRCGVRVQPGHRLHVQRRRPARGITRPNGVNSTYTYDVAGRLTSVVHAGGGGTLQTFTYALDAVGNRTSVTSLAGTENYTLDAINRLTNVTYPNGDVVGYTYDANGNRLTKTFNGTPTTYTYDNADQLSSDGTLTYTYDANGNTTAAGANTFTWDFANRMTGATVGGIASAYSYDGDDARVGKTVGGTPTNYVWDREDVLPLMVDDGTNAYLQEDGALAQVNGAGTPEYLLGDAVGSRRGVTNLAGTLTGTADYDTFGAVRGSTGTGSIFGYTGQQFDAETGYTYLLARYLNPSLGRFMSADTVQPNAPGTQGYNLYAYVANNPTTWVDPSGHSLEGDAYLTALVMKNPMLPIVLMKTCAPEKTPAPAKATPGEGLKFGVCEVSLFRQFTVPIIICALNPICIAVAALMAVVLDGTLPGPDEDPGDGTEPNPTPTPPPPTPRPSPTASIVYHYTDSASAALIETADPRPGWGQLNRPRNWVSTQDFDDGADAKELLAIFSDDPGVERVVDTKIIIDATASGITGAPTMAKAQFDQFLQRRLTGTGPEIRIDRPVTIRILRLVPINSSRGMR